MSERRIVSDLSKVSLGDNDNEEEILEQIKHLQQKLLKHREKSTQPSSESSFPGHQEERAQRLLVIANRLPVTLKHDAKSGEWNFKMSSGGLVSALMGVKNFEMVWVGWPGSYVDDVEQQEIIEDKLGELNCVPVWMNEDIVEKYYSGYSNNVLWPLFHYISLPINDLARSYGTWEAYQIANRMFADKVLSTYRKGDIIWVHDYHLMLLPGMLRIERPSVKIGFFLHIPFPSTEIYRVIPQREELLQGVLASDLIGFHTYDYCRHFNSACTRILGAESNGSKIELNSVTSHFDAFPIGIDANKFLQAMETEEVKKYIDEMKNQFAGKKIIVGVDRLDYTKGIPHRLYAIERLLSNYPQWLGKVILLQIAVPSRTDVKEYQRLSKEAHELVGIINGKYGSLTYSPINFLDQSIPFERLCALYHIGDVCICTSLRDGMNLVSFEYVACQKGKNGVLVLSEFAGSAQSLGAGCIRINPWDVDEVAAALNEALSMSDEEAATFHRYAMQYVCENSSQNWAEKFVRTLEIKRGEMKHLSVPPKLIMDSVVQGFESSHASRKLIILGLVGTISEKYRSHTRRDSYSRFSKVNPEIRNYLKELSSDPLTTVLIISSRDQETCEKACAGTDAILAAENGFYVKHPGEEHWTSLYETADLSWMEHVENVFEYYCIRTPGSYIEKQSSSISWHYKEADPDFGDLQSKDLVSHLKTGVLANTATDIINIGRLVQVRPSGVSKGNSSSRIMSSLDFMDLAEFVLCVGGFLSRDEDIFTMLSQGGDSLLSGTPKMSSSMNGIIASSPARYPSSMSLISSSASVFTVSIGGRPSLAQYFIRSVNEVQTLLGKLVRSQRK